MASLSCRCGQVLIELPKPPVRRLECCCIDCRNAFGWCAAQSNKNTSAHNEPPVPLINDAVYFPNALRVTKGQDQLKCYQIRKGYDTRRIVACCCWTCLMGDHPAYQGKRFITYNNVAHIQMKMKLQYHHPDADSSSSSMGDLLPVTTKRLFDDDLTTDQLKGLPPFVPPKVLPQWPPDPKAVDVSKHIGSGDYMSIQSLIENVIGTVDIMDPDYQGKPTHWSKLQRRRQQQK